MPALTLNVLDEVVIEFPQHSEVHRITRVDHFFKGPAINILGLAGYLWS